MLIVRLAVSLTVAAIFTYGIMNLVTTPVPSAKFKRTGTSCPGEKQIEGGRCRSNEQINGSRAPALERKASPGRIGTIILGREAHSDNCVFYARARVPSLPYGLGTWTGKLAIINAHDPQPGDVAIIHVGSGVYKDVGHVAIVEEVTDTTITILEGNFYAGFVSRRTATGASAKEAAGRIGIAGYFRPRGKSARTGKA